MAPLLHRAAIKSRDSEKKRSDHEVRGVSSGARKKSVLGKICERGSFRAGSERLSELWMAREPTKGKETGKGKSEIDTIMVNKGEYTERVE